MARPTAPKGQRLFLALWPEPGTARRLHGLLPVDRAPAVRVTPLQNLHLTLLFLGNVDATGRDCLLQRTEGLDARAFELRFERLRGSRRHGIYWVVPDHAPERLLALVEDLRGAARDCGIAVEARPFRAHVTLARRAQALAPRRLSAPLVWAPNSFRLVESRLTHEGASYRRVAEWALSGASTTVK